MKRATGRHKAFTRRAVLMCGAQAALLAGLVGRLYYLQVAQSDRYRVLADENRINLQLLAPPRGVILDRHGVVVAGNSQNYRVFLVPDQTRLPGEDVESAVARTLDLLGRLVPIGERSRQRVLRDVRRRREFVPVTVVENLSWQEFSRVNVLTPELPGVAPDVGPTRDYPLGAAAAHVVGYVAPVSATIPCWRCPASRSAAAAWSGARRSGCEGARAPATSRSTPTATSSASCSVRRDCRARMSR